MSNGGTASTSSSTLTTFANSGGDTAQRRKATTSVLFLPLELWNTIMIFIGHEQLLRHHVAWSLTCKALHRITNSNVLWLGRLVALHAAVQLQRTRDVVQILPNASVQQQQPTLPALLSLDVYKALVRGGAPTPLAPPTSRAKSLPPAAPHKFRWNWKYCFLHFFFGCVSQRCMICCCPPNAANQPTCHFSWHRRSTRRGDTTVVAAAVAPAARGEEAAVSLSPAAGPISASDLLQFPFEGCSMCSICLRKFCWLATMPQGKADAKLGRRFYGVNRGRWVVCIRSDVIHVIALGDDAFGDTEESSAAEGSSKRGRANDAQASPRNPSGYRIGRGEPYNTLPDGQDDHVTSAVVAPSHYSVRNFVARAQQSSHQKYITPSHRAHESPKDPLGFLTWHGHSVNAV